MRKKQAFLLALPAVLALTVFFLAPMLYILIKTLATNGLSDFVRFFTRHSFFYPFRSLHVSGKNGKICHSLLS